MITTPEHEAAIEEWVAHVAYQPHAVKRGLPARPVSPKAWRCEGQWQHPDQMDIWECLDEVVLDERRKRGDDEDEDD